MKSLSVKVGYRGVKPQEESQCVLVVFLFCVWEAHSRDFNKILTCKDQIKHIQLDRFLPNPMKLRLSIKIKADVNCVIIGKQHAESVFLKVQFNNSLACVEP